LILAKYLGEGTSQRAANESSLPFVFSPQFFPEYSPTQIGNGSQTMSSAGFLNYPA
jgi:hypothetical protein